MNRRLQGFSLLELLIAVAIVAILCVIAVVPAERILRGTREARAIADLKTVGNGEMAFYASRGRFAVFDELIRTRSLADQFGRGAPGGGPRGGATEAISDGIYLYTVRFSDEAAGITIDADPRKDLTRSYRRFRLRLGRVANGRGGSECVIYAAAPSVASPPASAFRPLAASQ